ncbi:MAG: tetratricopeptide repeat protein [Chromatiales bacterium]|nr:tetratricopeptide repeat protein [Chromatiales bacterium]
MGSWLAGLSCLLFMISCLADAGESTLLERLANGARYYRSGDYVTAEIEFRKAVRLAPGDRDAHTGLGLAQLRTRDFTAAAMELEKALALGATRADLILDLAEALLGSKQFEELLSDLEVLPEDDGRTVSGILRARGLAHLALGNDGNAFELFKAAHDRRPEDAPSMVCLAKWEMVQGNTDEARLWLGQAFSRDPDSAAALYVSGQLDFRAGDLSSARNSFRRVLARRPDYLPAIIASAKTELYLDNLDAADGLLDLIPKEQRDELVEYKYINALLALRRGRLEDAREYAEAVLAQVPRRAGALLLSALINQNLGTRELAYDQIRRYLEIVPDNELAIRLKAALERRLGMFTEASETVKAAAEAEAASELMRVMAAREELVSGDLSAALVRLDDERNRGIHAMPGYEELRKGLPKTGTDQLEAWLSHFVELEEMLNSPRYLAVRGAIAVGDTERAVTLATGFSIDHPELALVWHLRGVAEVFAGKRDDARTSLRRCSLMAPDYLSVKVDMASLEIADAHFDEAGRILSEVLDREPDNLYGLLSMAKVQAETEGMDAALASLDKAIQAHPSEQTVWLQKGRLLFSVHRYKDAEKVLKNAEPLGPENAEFLELFGRLQGASGKPEEAIAYFKRLTEQRPHSAEAFALYGKALSDVDRLEDASHALAAAWDLSSESMAIPLGLIDIYVREGETERALEVAALLRRKHPQDLRLLVLQGELQEHLGRNEDAVASYRIALAMDDGNDGVM